VFWCSSLGDALAFTHFGFLIPLYCIFCQIWDNVSFKFGGVDKYYVCLFVFLFVVLFVFVYIYLFLSIYTIFFVAMLLIGHAYIIIVSCMSLVCLTCLNTAYH
jgi:hypothetical protein